MTAAYLVSTALMGALVVLVAIAVGRTRQWSSYEPRHAGATGGEPTVPTGPPVLSRPTTWIVGFVVLLLAVVGGVAAFLTNPDAPSELTSGPILLGSVLFVGTYVLAGVYYAARGRGHPSSIAAAETATVFGTLFLLGVVAQLVG